MSLVCWSGGADSTLVLWQLARESSAANPVRTISIKHPQVLAWDPSRQARLAILAELKSRGCHVQAFEVEVLHRKVDEFDESKCEILSFGGLGQPGLWVSTAALYLLEHEDLFMGYVKDDEVWHSREELGQAFTAIKRMRHAQGNLQLPLEFVDKPMVYDDLEKAGLLTLTWSCEDPTKAGMACLACHPCEVGAVTEFVRARRKAGAEPKQITPEGEAHGTTEEILGCADVPSLQASSDAAGHSGGEGSLPSRGLHPDVATCR